LRSTSARSLNRRRNIRRTIRSLSLPNAELEPQIIDALLTGAALDRGNTPCRRTYSTCKTNMLSLCLSVCLPVCLYDCPSVCLSVCLSVCSWIPHEKKVSCFALRTPPGQPEGDFQSDTTISHRLHQDIGTYRTF